jgi:N-acetylglucosamine kinase-like BadF-type ATPase
VELYIGVNGGHQKSVAVALTDSRIVGCTSGDSLNLHTFSPDEVIERFGDLLESLSSRVGIDRRDLRSRTIKLVLSLPGAAMEDDRKLARYCMAVNDWRDRSKFAVVDDTWAGLYGGALSSRGICAFAGSGASVFVGLGEYKSGKSHKMDGWGPILGDFGSGFQLVVDTFRFFGRSLDKGYTPPLFKDFVNLEPKISEITKVQAWFDSLYIRRPSKWRIHFAGLAAAVTAAADRPEADSDAVKLVRQAAEEMARSVEVALDRFKGEIEDLPIVFQGGMFEHSRLYRSIVAGEIGLRFSNEVRMAPFRTVFGAALMARTNLAGEIDEGTLDPIRSSIADLRDEERELLTYSDLEIGVAGTKGPDV